jgi:DNA-binding NtrC family response regulator
MDEQKILDNKKILIVDDEKDVLETLSDLLDMCRCEWALDFETAQRLLDTNDYDLAILDIMGVNGYELLEQAGEKGVPTLMFTAHALSPEAFEKSMGGGAKAYIPKEEMANIAEYAAEILTAQEKGLQRPGKWFGKLKSFFENQFGKDWMNQYKEAREKYDWLDFDE